MIENNDRKTIVSNLLDYINKRNSDRLGLFRPLFFYQFPIFILGLFSLFKISVLSSGFHFIILIPFVMLIIARMYVVYSNLHYTKQLKDSRDIVKISDAINLAPYTTGAEYGKLEEYKDLLDEYSYDKDTYTEKLYRYFCYNLYSNFLSTEQLIILFTQFCTCIVSFLVPSFINKIAGFTLLINMCLYFIYMRHFKKEGLLITKWGNAVNMLSGYSDIDSDGNIEVNLIVQTTDKVTVILKRIALNIAKFKDKEKNREIEKIINNLLSVFESLKEKDDNGEAYYNLNTTVVEDVIVMLETIDKTIDTCVKNNNTIKDKTIDSISKEVDEFVENTKLNIGKLYSKSINDLVREVETEIAVSEGDF